MKLKKIFSILFITTCLCLSATACGEEDPAATDETTEDQTQEPATMDDPYITGGDVSPFYQDPTEENVESDPEVDAAAQELEERVQDIIAGNEAPSSDSEESEDTTPARLDYDLYVATYGSDDNDGTSEAPFATIQKAIDSVTPGHKIYLRSGSYKGPNKFNISGEEGAPIIITHTPDCNASSVMVTLGYGQDGAIFDINGQSNIQIIDIRIGNSYSNWIYGVYIPKGSSNIRIEENEFIDITAPDVGGSYAVLIYGDGDTEDTAVHDIYIYDNEVHNVITGQGMGLAAAGNVQNITFDGNHVYSVTGIGIDLYGGGRTSFDDALDQPRNCTVIGNEVHHCWAYNDKSNSGILIDGAKDSLVRDNYVYECPVGIEIASENYNYDYTTRNIQVIGNTVHDNHDTGISIGGYNPNYYGVVHDTEVAENIIYNNGYKVNDGCNGEIHFEKVDNIIVRDNIVRNHDYKYPVIGCGKTSEYVKNVSFVNNLYAYDKPEKIVFRFQGNEYIGLDAWNTFTGGSDVNAAGGSK